MSGDDKITSRRVFRRCFQLDLFSRRCSVSVSGEGDKRPWSWQGLLSPRAGLVRCFFIIDCVRLSRAKPIPRLGRCSANPDASGVGSKCRGELQILHPAAVELARPPGARAAYSPISGPFKAMDPRLQSYATKE